MATFTPINTITSGQVQGAQNDYNTDQGALSSANQNLSNFQNTMQTGQQMYNAALPGANAEAGYDPQQLQKTLGNLSQLQGIIGGLPQSISAQNSNYGATAGNLAGQYSGQMSSLNPALNSETQQATNELATQQGALQGAQNITTAGVQTQAQQLQGLTSAAQQAQNQYATAQSQLQSLQQLYESQGQFNASQQAVYEQANAAMLAAQGAYNQAMAQASLLQAQTTGQGIQNTSNQNLLNQAITAQQGANSMQTKGAVNTGAGYTSDFAQPQTPKSNPSLLSQLEGLFKFA